MSVKKFLAIYLALLLLMFTATGSALANISLITSQTNVNSDSGVGTLTINQPAGVQVGDFLLAQITFEKGTDINNLVSPTGWVLVRRDNRGSDLGQAIFYKFATVSGTATHTWEFRKGTSFEQVRAAGGIIVYTGVDTTNPIVNSSGNSGDSKTLTAPNIANALANSMLVAFFGIKKKTTLSTPAGMDEIYFRQHSNGSGPTVKAAHELRTSDGATDPRTSNAGESEKWVAQLVTLRAAPGYRILVFTCSQATNQLVESKVELLDSPAGIVKNTLDHPNYLPLNIDEEDLCGITNGASYSDLPEGVQILEVHVNYPDTNQ